MATPQVPAEFSGYAAYGAKEEVKPFKYVPRPLGKDDVDIKISHCGMCSSDVHQIDNGWGGSNFPMVPGHEIVGEVVGKGDDVKNISVGDRVGVGAQCWACHECDLCKQHDEPLCPKRVFTYNGRYADGALSYGGYANFVRCDSRFAFKIPENLASDAVAPLFCAGATVFSPMKHFGVEGKNLGVLGIGGLGHLAIRFGKALGNHVTAISSKPDKEVDCKKLGADAFIVSSNKEQMQAAGRTLDAIITTVDVNVNWGDYLGLLKPDGKLIFVGLPNENLSINGFGFISQRLSICGSLIGSPALIEEMLKLASEKNIVAQVTVWPIEQVNEAIKCFREGKPMFRYVLKMD